MRTIIAASLMLGATLLGGCTPAPPGPASGPAIQPPMATMGSDQPRSAVGGGQGNNTGSGPGGGGAASGP